MSYPGYTNPSYRLGRTMRGYSAAPPSGAVRRLYHWAPRRSPGGSGLALPRRGGRAGASAQTSLKRYGLKMPRCSS